MTTRDIVVPNSMHPWTRLLIKHDMNVVLVAQELFKAGDDTVEQQQAAMQQGINLIHDWIIDNYDELTALMYKKFKLTYVTKLNTQVLEFNDNTMLQTFDRIVGNQQIVVAPNMGTQRNQNPLDLADDIFSEFESPRAKLNAELDRLRARNGGENGHT